MNIYEINQQAYSELPKMTQQEIDTAIEEILKPYFNEQYDCGQHYYMLLNNELHDYTVFHQKNCEHSTINQLAKEIIELIKERGTLKGIEATTQGIEFWITSNKTSSTHMFLLFDYDWGVISIGQSKSYYY